jgi:hypothetical protein
VGVRDDLKVVGEIEQVLEHPRWRAFRMVVLGGA